MTPEIQQEIQRLEHANRLLEERLAIKDRSIHALTNEAGTLRCEMQRNENRIHEIVTRRGV